MMIVSCKKAAKIASDALERRLSLRERIGLATHGMMCRACRLYIKQLRTIRLVARRYAQEELSPTITSQKPAPNDVRKRIKDKLNERLARPEPDAGADQRGQESGESPSQTTG